MIVQSRAQTTAIADKTLALDLIASGQFADAIPALDRYLVKMPTDADAHNSRGYTLLTLKKESALILASLNEAIRLDPTHIFAYNNKANLHLSQGEYKEAEVCFKQVLTLNPTEGHMNCLYAAEKQDASYLLPAPGASYASIKYYLQTNNLMMALLEMPSLTDKMVVPLIYLPLFTESFVQIGRSLLAEAKTVEAKKCFEKAAAAKNLEAQKQWFILENNTLITAEQWGNLGEAYYYGNHGKTQDRFKAAACLQRTLDINPNHVRALYLLGWQYHYAQEVPKDLVKARTCHTQAANQNYYPSVKELLILDHPTFTTVAQWYELAVNFHNGTSGYTQDYVKARACYEEAFRINPNDQDTTLNLGMLFSFGKGVTRDLQEAKKYHDINKGMEGKLILANSHLTTAQDWYEFGDRLYFGKNISKDHFQAACCYGITLAIDANHIEAFFRLGFQNQYGQGIKKDLAKARQFYEKAIRQKHLNSTIQLLILDNPKISTADKWCNLGEEYYYGKGKLIDKLKSAACFQQALNLNAKHQRALYMSGWQYQHGEELGLDIVKAKAYYEKAVEQGCCKSTKQLVMIECGATLTVKFEPRVIVNPSTTSSGFFTKIGDIYINSVNIQGPIISAMPGSAIATVPGAIAVAANAKVAIAQGSGGVAIAGDHNNRIIGSDSKQINFG